MVHAPTGARQVAKLEATAKAPLTRHQTADGEPVDADDSERRTERLTGCIIDAAELREWLAANPEDRRGSSGNVVKSNRTDTEQRRWPPIKALSRATPPRPPAVDAKHQIAAGGPTVRTKPRGRPC